MTPDVKRWDKIVRISVLFVIGCMVTGCGPSKLPERLLTAEMAERWDGTNSPVDISQFTSIEDEAAEELAKHKRQLYLVGLTSLSDGAAEALGKHEGELILGGLTSLSDAQAEGLAKHKGELLLDGLTSLSDKQAEGLAKHEGVLGLSGLTELSDYAAETLAKYRGEIYFDHDKLPPSASKVLKDAGRF